MVIGGIQHLELEIGLPRSVADMDFTQYTEYDMNPDPYLNTMKVETEAELIIPDTHETETSYSEAEGLNLESYQTEMQCMKCSLKFFRKLDLDSHICIPPHSTNTSSVQQMYSGPNVQPDFSNNLLFVPSGTIMYTCNICHACFPKLLDWELHMKGHYKPNKDSRGGGETQFNQFQCDLCPGKYYQSQDTLEKHIQMHHSNNAFESPVGSERFPEAGHLSRNVGLHHDSENLFQCSSHQFQCATSSEWILHVKMNHPNPQKRQPIQRAPSYEYKCTKCITSTKFKFPSQLRHHDKKVHGNHGPRQSSTEDVPTYDGGQNYNNEEDNREFR